MTYTPPTPDQVRKFLVANSLTGSVAAGLAGLSDAAQIRKYTGGQKPHRMSYAIWFTLHAKTMLQQSQIAAIESAMRQGCPPPCK